MQAGMGFPIKTTKDLMPKWEGIHLPKNNACNLNIVQGKSSEPANQPSNSTWIFVFFKAVVFSREMSRLSPSQNLTHLS